MSNVYILEPPTTGKVLLKTTVGDIDIELWAKETPKTCRNFIQLCLEGYYNGTTFHRIVKGFIAQGGDPNGDGTGGESIYGETFKDEFHQRLRFARRGLVAMANAGKDDNASQFFFTLAATPELQNKHTIFGKVTGETVFNMLKLEEGLLEGETPVYPHKIIKTDVLNNPFPDIEPRVTETPNKEKKKKKDRTPGVKNFKLLSFGEEAEEDEEETSRVNEIYAGKGKSTHDVLDDPKLSSATIDTPATVDESITDKADDEDDDEEDDEEDDEAAAAARAQRLENIKNKLKGVKNQKPVKKIPIVTTNDEWDEEKVDEKKRKYDEIQKEIETVKRDYHKNKLKRVEEKVEEEKQEEMRKGDNFKEYKDTYQKYKNKKKELPKKGAGREQFTLSLLSKFKEKLNSAKENKEEASENASEDKDDIDKDENWLSHELHFVDENPVLAKDANTKDDDWFEIYDPRNPLNKRRRGEATKNKTKK